MSVHKYVQQERRTFTIIIHLQLSNIMK